VSLWERRQGHRTPFEGASREVGEHLRLAFLSTNANGGYSIVSFLEPFYPNLFFGIPSPSTIDLPSRCDALRKIELMQAVWGNNILEAPKFEQNEKVTNQDSRVSGHHFWIWQIPFTASAVGVAPYFNCRWLARDTPADPNTRKYYVSHITDQRFSATLEA
jgi:hypothetical protein